MRGSAMVEFVLMLPILVFSIMFIVDMGQVILVNGAMQDVAYSTARAGAQVGGGSLTASGQFPCGTRTTAFGCASGASYTAFQASVKNAPGYANNNVVSPQMRLLSGGRCVANTTRSRADNHVTAQVRYQQKLVTPGLAQLLSASGANIKSGRWEMTVTASSRCEVVR